MKRKLSEIALISILLLGVGVGELRTDLEISNFRDITVAQDPESLFAQGKRIALEKIDLFTLLLLPRISERVAIGLFHKRDEIKRQAEKLHPDEKHHTFELVKGIGPITSKELEKYLKF